MLTIDVKDALISLLILAIIVLIIFSIVAVHNLIITLKKTHKMLDDFGDVAGIASTRTKELDKFITEAQKKMKGGAGLLSSLPAIFKAIAGIVKGVNEKKKKDS